LAAAPPQNPLEELTVLPQTFQLDFRGLSKEREGMGKRSTGKARG